MFWRFPRFYLDDAKLVNTIKAGAQVRDDRARQLSKIHINLENTRIFLKIPFCWFPGQILYIPYQSVVQFMQGEFRHIPLIIGTDKDDGYIFITGAFTHPLGELIYDAVLRFIGGKLGTSVADDYPPVRSAIRRTTHTTTIISLWSQRWNQAEFRGSNPILSRAASRPEPNLACALGLAPKLCWISAAAAFTMSHPTYLKLAD